MIESMGPEELRTGDEDLLAALRDSNERLREERQIFVSGPVVVFKWRNAPGWPVEYASPNVDGVFGYTAAEFLAGKVAYADIILPEDLVRVAGEVQAASEGGRASFEHEPYRIRSRDGRVVWLLDFTTILRGKDGQAEHYLGYVIDITDRKQAEEESERLERQLLYAQKLESLGVLAGGIAHDFNNLLTSILCNAGFARAGLPQDSKAGRSLADIEAAATRAADLCQQMLAYAGKGRFVLGSYDLNQLVREMGHLLEVSISKGVELRYDFAPQLPPVEADATQIRQLVMNLITNASEAIGKDQGTVVLRTGVARAARGQVDATAAELTPGEYVFLRVSDDGCGMDERTRRQIFDPFFTTKFEGRGLGLAAVLGIVRGHGGAIRVESAPGKGTTFEVLLPCSDQPASAPPLESRFDELWRGRGSVLIVDDEPAVREIAQRVLESAGFRVVTAQDGLSGVATFRQMAPEVSVVLLDLTMPRLGGVDTLRELRAIRADVPVVLTSGYEQLDVVNRFQGLERATFLQKPFQPRQLLAAARAVIEAR